MRSIVMRRDVGNDAASNVVPLVARSANADDIIFKFSQHRDPPRLLRGDWRARSDPTTTGQNEHILIPFFLLTAVDVPCSSFMWWSLILRVLWPASKNTAPRHCKMLRPTNKASLRGMPEADSVGIPFRISRRY